MYQTRLLLLIRKWVNSRKASKYVSLYLFDYLFCDMQDCVWWNIQYPVFQISQHINLYDMGVQRIAKTRYILLIIVLTSTVLHMFLTDIIPNDTNDPKKITYDGCDSQKTKNPLGKMSIKSNSNLFYVSQET